MIQDILIVGSGSAGLIAALSLKRKIPQVGVRIIRSPEIGIIGVGEGSTPTFPAHLFNFLNIPRKTFYKEAEPTWKLGNRFKWGPRGSFAFTFSHQLDAQWTDLPRPHGYYCDSDFTYADITSALIAEGKAFLRQPNGCPDIQPWHSFHIENEKFVTLLEKITLASGIEILDGEIAGAERGPQGISAVCLKDGRKLEADFFVDCSGFRAELIGKVLDTPFCSFNKTLFCDRAVVGGWARQEEPILPYTTAEQMSTGWSWQIEHEHRINRGYVYCSEMISDEDAELEFRKKNPKVKDTRIVKFRSGCRTQNWVENVVAIGNSAGFVEPLEATALTIVCSHSQSLVESLLQNELNPTPSMRSLYNDMAHGMWLNIRDFLGLHYQPNTAMDTPFWKRCHEETDLSGIQGLLEFYEQNGPTGLNRYHLRPKQNEFGLDGFLVMLVGQMVPYQNRHQATPQEIATWNRHREENRIRASQGMTVAEALQYVRHPDWQWTADR